MFFTKDELTTPRCSFIRTILRISRKKWNVVNVIKGKASSTRQLASESVTIMWKIRLLRPIKDTCPWNLKVATNKKWQPCAYSNNTMPKGKSSLIHNHSTLPFRNPPLLFIIIRCLQEAEANKLSFQQKAPHGVEFKESQDVPVVKFYVEPSDSLGNSKFWSWWLCSVLNIVHIDYKPSCLSKLVTWNEQPKARIQWGRSWPTVCPTRIKTRESVGDIHGVTFRARGTDHSSAERHNDITNQVGYAWCQARAMHK